MRALTVFFPLFISSVAFGQSTQPSGNLVPNGNFEQSEANPQNVVGWQPLRHGFDRIDTQTDRGHVIQFTIPRQVARSEGFQFYSSRFPIEQDRIYRCRADVFTDGPQVVLFLNGYAQLGGQERRVYRKQIKSEKRIEKNAWGTLNFRFTPRQPSAISNKVLKHLQKTIGEVARLEVEFFVYGADGGIVQVDNVEIIPVDDAIQTRPASRPINRTN